MAKRDYFVLDVNAPIFNELSKLPTWWQHICKDKDLYVNIRKDNRVHVYYKGAAVMKDLHYGRQGLVCQIDKEYRKGWADNREGNHVFPADEIVKHLDKIKENIENYYNSKKEQPEGKSEREIQGELYINGKYGNITDIKCIDTEYAYAYSRYNIIRIDLITITKEGHIEFVELKRISDERLLKEKGSLKTPKIIKQIKDYNEFIKDNSDNIKGYYNNVQEIMKKIGVRNPYVNIEIKGVEPLVRLLFAGYKEKKNHSQRIKRVKRIADEILKGEQFKSNIDELAKEMGIILNN